MLFLLLISLFTVLAYLLLMFIFIYGWMRNPSFEKIEHDYDTKCTIIIPARNESGKIENILSDIIQQDYPRHLYEIIVVNDHSEDNTAHIVSFFQQGNHISLINLDNEKKGKKQALSEGIRLSNGELILTLDADCRVNKKWLSTMVAFFKQNGSTLMVGPVDYRTSKGFWNQIQNLEFLSLVGTSACAIFNNQPFLCNGANLAYRKKTFQQFDDPFNHNASSGDDVFFMYNIKNLPESTIHFVKHSDAIVYTSGVESFKQFISQRLRWSSKSKLITDTDSLVFITIISVTNLLILGLFLLSIVFIKALFLFAGVFFIKYVIDRMFFKQILPFFGKEKLTKYILLTDLLYFIYYTILFFLTVFVKPSWKGRKVKV